MKKVLIHRRKFDKEVKVADGYRRVSDSPQMYHGYPPGTQFYISSEAQPYLPENVRKYIENKYGKIRKVTRKLEPKPIPWGRSKRSEEVK